MRKIVVLQIGADFAQQSMPVIKVWRPMSGKHAVVVIDLLELCDRAAHTNVLTWLNQQHSEGRSSLAGGSHRLIFHFAGFDSQMRLLAVLRSWALGVHSADGVLSANVLAGGALRKLKRFHALREGVDISRQTI